MTQSQSSSSLEEHPVTVTGKENPGFDSSDNEVGLVLPSSPEKESSDTKDFKVITSRDADVTLRFLEENDHLVEPITPEEERKLSRKVMWIVVSLTALINLILYADKAVMSYAAIFTFFEDTGLTQNKYNNANTLFYFGYIVGQGNLFFLQKFPLSRVMFVMTALWSIIIFLHCTAYNYQGVYALRFFLGFVESIGVPSLNTTMGQFLTPQEKSATAPVFYAACMGVTIPVGFIAYGVLNITNSSIPTWKIFSIIIGCCTFLSSVLIFLVYPSNPTDAKFLSKKEKIWVIRRVQQTTGSSIEQKTFKPYQAKEALKDPISWIFGAFFLLQQLANNLTYQQNLLFEDLGNITALDSTLVSVASGGFAVVMAIIASTFLMYKKNFIAFSVVVWSLPSFVGSIGAATLPWHNSIGLLAFVCLACPVFGIPWILMFSWNAQTCSGYTKKMTRNAIVMFWFGISNIISPQLWQERDAPRYIPAWIVQIVLSFFLAPSLALVIWFILRRRNKERLAKLDSAGKQIGVIEENGERTEVNVALLDLTDLENEAFIYPL
ncbi:Yct1p [Lachancea thermotolerans CBS 6340]|uniref:KLTH0C00330p n=1 Tax=Lachancea thermotolerans (strain ATCC 56472 / CBS 6340 / NRRL Y-8284) TaxID=559295 RepID=C5DDE3_LACTC|nr:KLTH0C00330p [Lachancea thermotolerans CBS 6340]CAR21804.1 KLTH0C00330p [Lachancea thermotolerans CBS 6340]